MALELETEIMQEIGLGPDYQFYNGSRTCEYIREKAAKALFEAIKRYHDSGKEISAPNQELIGMVCSIAQRGERSNSELTRTWEAASYVIATHINEAKSSQEKRNREFTITKQFLQEHYLNR